MKKIIGLLGILLLSSSLFAQTVNIRGNKLQLRYGTESLSITLMGDSIYFDGNLMKFGRAFGGDSLVIGADTVYGGGFYVTDTLGVTTYRLLGVDTIAEGGGGSGVLDTGYVKTTGDSMYGGYYNFNSTKDIVSYQSAGYNYWYNTNDQTYARISYQNVKVLKGTNLYSTLNYHSLTLDNVGDDLGQTRLDTTGLYADGTHSLKINFNGDDCILFKNNGGANADVEMLHKIIMRDPYEDTLLSVRGNVNITGTLTIPDTVTLNAVLAAGTVTKLKIGLFDSITIDTINALRLYGNATVWDDYVVPATRTYVNPSTSLPAFDLDSIALKFVRDADSSEVAYFTVQIPHAAKYGTSVVCSPHFHYMQYAAGDTTFKVALMYRIHKIGGTSGAWVRLRYSTRAMLTFTTAPFHQICEFPNIALNNVSESSIIDFKLYRYDSAGNPATMYYKSFDVHFEIDKLGSNAEYPSH